MKRLASKALIAAAVLTFHASNVKALEFMDVDDIRPGMTGYGLTVFHGTKIDTFNVEIIDIMKDHVPKGDLILARLSGGVVDTAGVIAGMSGSPIYVDGKLLGALAYSFGFFPTESLAGITPIEEMLNPPSGAYLPRSGKFSRIKLPIGCPGLDDQMLEELQKQLPCFDVMKTQEGGEIRNDSVILRPGASMGVLLLEGDLTWCAMGTCTYVQGDNVWGFGHPMAALGKTELPMTGGYIYSVVPSTCYSYKIGTPTKVVGTIENDSDRGIAGIMGKPADMVTLNIIVGNQEFHYRIIREKTFVRFLFSAVLLYSIHSGVKGAGDLTCQADLDIRASLHNAGAPGSISAQDSDAGLSPVSFRVSNLYTGTPQSISSSITQAFTRVQNNSFQKINIDEISVRLTTSHTVKRARIGELRVDKKEVEPGDTLNLLISLSVFQAGYVKKPVQITIPPWVRKKELTLKVENGKAVRERRKSQLTTISAFKKWLRESPKDNEIVITLTQKGRSGRISGEEFQSLPPSVASFVEGKSKEGNTIFETRVPTEWVITQRKSTKLEVQ
jgi:hypothetical protein